MKLPVHRWFRYSAGFSAQWVENAIAEAKARGSVTVLDPFAGAGTTLLAAEKLGVQVCGVEAHPFVARVAAAKLLYRSDPESYLAWADEVKRCARSVKSSVDGYPALIHKCFDPATLACLDRLREAAGWVRPIGVSLADDSGYSSIRVARRDRAVAVRLAPQDKEGHG